MKLEKLHDGRRRLNNGGSVPRDLCLCLVIDTFGMR